MGLGALEREVMGVGWGVWGGGVVGLACPPAELSVREAQAIVNRPVAYTTLMTTFDRLHKKRLLTRRKSGRAFVYAAALSREALDRAVASELVGGLLQSDAGGPLPVLSTLVDTVTDRDRALLDELERLVAAKRDALGHEEQP
jgi:predicted transcriptional regulator